MILAHIMGIPVEESVLGIAAGAGTASVLLVTVRARLQRLGKAMRRVALSRRWRT